MLNNLLFFSCIPALLLFNLSLSVTKIPNEGKTDWLSTNVREFPKGRIIGGHKAVNKQFPYQVSIQEKVNYQHTRHFCGGSIIGVKAILTAAHCIDEAKPDKKKYSIVAGILSFKTRLKTTQYRSLNKVIRHPGYNPMTGSNDCLLIIVNEPFVFSEGVSTVKLAEHRPEVKSKCVLAGWGYVKAKPLQRTESLFFITTHIANDDLCSTVYPSEYDNTSMICGGGEFNKDSCGGDSGGPLVCDGVQVGILSFGSATCGVGIPQVFTNVAKYRNWISNELRKNSASSQNHYNVFVKFRPNCYLSMIINLLRFIQINYVFHE